MDLKSFKPPDWLLVGGGAVVFLFGFFDWFDTGSISSSAFKFTLTGVFPWLLIVGSALLHYQIRTGILHVQKWPWPTIFLFATSIGAILILVRVIIGADTGDFGVPDDASVGLGRKFTLWLSFIGAIAAAGGAALNFIAAGGTVNDLPLVPKLRQAVSQRATAAKAKKAQSAKSKAAGAPGDSGGRRLPPAEQDRPFDVDDDTDWGGQSRDPSGF